MNISKEYYVADRKVYNDGGGIFLFHRCLRIAHFTKNPIVLFLCRIVLRLYRLFYGLEISYVCNIGKGLYIGHPYNITINPKVVIGEHCFIHKGILLGQENRGHRKGCPQIGNRVWIGINAAVVGNIKIGDDVLIAPNSYVNIDIPSHSVVYGNPCVVKHRDNATEGYI